MTFRIKLLVQFIDKVKYEQQCLWCHFHVMTLVHQVSYILVHHYRMMNLMHRLICYYFSPLNPLSFKPWRVSGYIVELITVESPFLFFYNHTTYVQTTNLKKTNNRSSSQIVVPWQVQHFKVE
jgi:hypothetical protein